MNIVHGKKGSISQDVLKQAGIHLFSRDFYQDVYVYGCLRGH